MLADNKSTPKVGTTVHTIIHGNVCSNLRMCNVGCNCTNVMTKSFHHLAVSSIKSAVDHKNAVLCSTHCPRFTGLRKRLGKVRRLGGFNVSNLVMVNKSKSCHKKTTLAGLKFPAVNVPKAVSGSVPNASCALNFSATVGAMLRSISGVESATADRVHAFIIRMVNEGTKSVTL